jgi:tetratricopeptide (TPR) repeat protein
MTEVPRTDEATLALPDSQATAAETTAGTPLAAGPDDRLSVAALERIDRACLAFEDAWLSGTPLSIEECCQEAAEPDRSVLLRHLLLLELDYRLRRGEAPHRDEYVLRFPGDLPTVEAAFVRHEQSQKPSLPGALPRRFGDYELLEEIARGGMGIVFRARQLSLNRIVALKMILAGELASEADVKRFRAEAEAAAHLDHPGIVPIYEVGFYQGQHYFSMGYVDGHSLAAQMTQGPLPPRDAAEIVGAVAQAVQYAHEKGVIHRDLKPANILLDRSGHPRITDFGLAKRVAGKSHLTSTGQILGTPSYMPPEQAAGKLHQIGPLSDVYALGAVLYALLTGQPPFKAANPLDTLRQVSEQEPVAPRRLNAGVPIDLETVCLKALDKEPGRRYPSASEMAADLERYLGGCTIVARRASPVGRLLRWAQRSRAVVVAVLCAAALGLLAALFAWQSHRAHEQLTNAKRQRAIDDALLAAWNGDFEQAVALTDEAERLGASPGAVQTLRGQVAFHRHETGDAVRHLTEAVKLLPTSPAARAMLAVAYWQNGKWEECEKTLNDLEGLTPVTPEDHLFQGYARAAFDPSWGLESIDEAIRQRPNWTIAHALAAEVRSWLAQDRADPQAIQRALEDAQIVKAMLPGKPIGPLVSLYANLVAATIYAEQNQPRPREEALQRAAADAERLKSYPQSGWAVLIRYRYLEYIGRDDDAWAEMRAAVGKVKSSWPATFCALGLYRRGRCEEALQVLDGIDPHDVGAFQDTMRVCILAELPAGDQQAMRAYTGALGRYQGTSLLFQHAVLYLLGRPSEAATAYRTVQLPPSLAKLRRGSFAKLLEFNRGSISADELLRAVPDSKYHQCNAHFFIAMSLLAEGDRAGAREHFARCLATRCFDFDASDWSRTFVTRMDQDASWPRWIPARR